MKIRTRITLLFTLITAAILLAFATVIYYSAKENREKAYFSLLQKEALTKAHVFLNAKVDTLTLQNIYRNNREMLHEVEVAIYDTDFNLHYHDAVDIDMVKETPRMLEEIRQKGDIYFYQDKWQVVGIRHTYQQKEYLITATAYDQYGYQKLHLLFKNILIFFILSIIVIFMAGMLFSKKAFDPVREMTEKARNISATNLHLRLNIQDHQDEISELALTFNHMLQRLENAFDAQKHFVSHIAHELRTPLAAIISELELCISSEQTVEEYQRVVQNAWGDAHRLSRLFSNLLDVAKANYDPAEINFKPIRMDEVLLDASLQVQQSNPHYHLQISYDFDTDTVHDANEHLLTINGNEYLLKVAFANLMENACKFSENHTCQISISTAPLSHHQSKNILLYFKDKGIGMTDDDVSHIFQPFYRGNNKPYADGNGIGLYLTQKIVHLHQGTITVDSTPQKGTTFTVALPPSLVS